jgi:hypothetical protein
MRVFVSTLALSLSLSAIACGDGEDLMVDPDQLAEPVELTLRTMLRRQNALADEPHLGAHVTYRQGDDPWLDLTDDTDDGLYTLKVTNRRYEVAVECDEEPEGAITRGIAATVDELRELSILCIGALAQGAHPYTARVELGDTGFCRPVQFAVGDASTPPIIGQGALVSLDLSSPIQGEHDLIVWYRGAPDCRADGRVHDLKHVPISMSGELTHRIELSSFERAEVDGGSVLSANSVAPQAVVLGQDWITTNGTIVPMFDVLGSTVALSRIPETMASIHRGFRLRARTETAISEVYARSLAAAALELPPTLPDFEVAETSVSIPVFEGAEVWTVTVVSPGEARTVIATEAWFKADRKYSFQVHEASTTRAQLGAHMSNKDAAKLIATIGDVRALPGDQDFDGFEHRVSFGIDDL